MKGHNSKLNGMKRCSRCHRSKPLSDFYVYTERDPHATGKLHAACKRCEHDARAEHRRNHPVKASYTAWKAKIKRMFGITPAQHEALQKRQGNRCAICKRPSPDGRRLHLDHDHKNKTVRGLLCHDCNRGLGMFRDSIQQLEACIDYLKNNPSKGICS